MFRLISGRLILGGGLLALIRQGVLAVGGCLLTLGRELPGGHGFVDGFGGLGCRIEVLESTRLLLHPVDDEPRPRDDHGERDHRADDVRKHVGAVLVVLHGVELMGEVIALPLLVLRVDGKALLVAALEGVEVLAQPLLVLLLAVVVSCVVRQRPHGRVEVDSGLSGERLGSGILLGLLLGVVGQGSHGRVEVDGGWGLGPVAIRVLLGGLVLVVIVVGQRSHGRVEVDGGQRLGPIGDGLVDLVDLGLVRWLVQGPGLLPRQTLGLVGFRRLVDGVFARQGAHGRVEVDGRKSVRRGRALHGGFVVQRRHHGGDDTLGGRVVVRLFRLLGGHLGHGLASGGGDGDALAGVVRLGPVGFALAQTDEQPRLHAVGVRLHRGQGGFVLRIGFVLVRERHGFVRHRLGLVRQRLGFVGRLHGRHVRLRRWLGRVVLLVEAGGRHQHVRAVSDELGALGFGDVVGRHVAVLERGIPHLLGQLAIHRLLGVGRRQVVLVVQGCGMGSRRRSGQADRLLFAPVGYHVVRGPDAGDLTGLDGPQLQGLLQAFARGREFSPCLAQLTKNAEEWAEFAQPADQLPGLSVDGDLVGSQDALLDDPPLQQRQVLDGVGPPLLAQHQPLAAQLADASLGLLLDHRLVLDLTVLVDTVDREHVLAGRTLHLGAAAGDPRSVELVFTATVWTDDAHA